MYVKLVLPHPANFFHFKRYFLREKIVLVAYHFPGVKMVIVKTHSSANVIMDGQGSIVIKVMVHVLNFAKKYFYCGKMKGSKNEISRTIGIFYLAICRQGCKHGFCDVPGDCT